jgi:hypothetical protein
VIEDVCKKYSCACTVKTAGKPSQPIEKSTAGASLLTQVIVAKHADHCRKRTVDVETGDGGQSGISKGGDLKPGPCGIRLEGGVNLDQALIRNVGTCRFDVKGASRAGDPREALSTDAEHRDRTARSREEGAVMALDRRGCGVHALAGGQPAMGGAA